MLRIPLSRSGYQLWTAATRRLVLLKPTTSPASVTTRSIRKVVTDPTTLRVSYSTTSVLSRKFEVHNEHININKGTASQQEQDYQDSNSSHHRHSDNSNNKVNGSDSTSRSLLSDDDDLMVGNEGLEAIDPKDFPELYPTMEEIEGLDQESHPDQEGRDYDEDVDDATATTLSPSTIPKSSSVLLSDKERSEEEFSWFVDESFTDYSVTEKNSKVEVFEGGVVSPSDFVPLWQRNTQQQQQQQQQQQAQGQEGELHEGEQSIKSVSDLAKMIELERAKNVKVIDMRDKCDWTDWMIIAEGLSERHLGNVADHIYSALKKNSPNTSPPVMEGRDTTDWVVIDAGSVVIHFMTPEARKERDLEGLWASVKSPLKIKDTNELSWDDVKGQMTKSWNEDHGRSRGEDGKRGRRGMADIPLSDVVKW